MIEKKAILKMAKHVFRQTRNAPDRHVIHPSREWLFGLVFFAILLGSGGIYAAKTFVTYQNIDTAEGEATERLPQYQVTNVETALEKYDARKAQFASYRDTVVELIESDPVAVGTQEVEDVADEEEAFIVPDSLDLE